MATFVRDIDPEDFAPIIAELERKPLEMNKYRKNSGEGRSQAFGFSRRQSYRPWITRHTYKRIELYKLLVEFAEKHSIHEWDAVVVNQNYETKPHKDVGNHGQSYICAFGEFTGGELQIYDEPVDIRHKLVMFDGSELLHSTAPFKGTRYSIVFYRICIPEQFLSSEKKLYKVRGEVIKTETGELQLLVSDSYNNSIIVLNKKGKIVETRKSGDSTGEWVGLLTSGLKSKK